MPEEKKSEPRFSFGSLLLAGVLVNLVLSAAGFDFASITVPIAILTTLWYGPARGFLVGFVGVAFSDVLLFSVTADTWVHAFLAGISALFGIKASESDLFLRVLVATLLFIKPERFVQELNNLIAQVILNLVVVALIYWFLLSKAKD